MIVLERGQTYNCSSPKLVFYHQVDGWLTDVYSLSFQIFDVSSPQKFMSPEQVYPATPGDKSDVDVDNDCPTGGKLGTGRYAATWAVDADLDPGSYEIRWFWKTESTSDEETTLFKVDVMARAGVIPAGLYCSIGDMRDELVTTAQYSDVQVLNAIHRASRMIERYTGRRFYPQYKEMVVDGPGGRVLPLLEPIIAILQMEITLTDWTTPTSTILSSSASAYRVYNRHMQGTVSPDDRESPAVALMYATDAFGAYEFPKGHQNIKVTGIFGYTDPDGSPFGRTPELIRRATQLMIMKDLVPIGDTDERENIKNRHRIQSERTRDQQYVLSDAFGSHIMPGSGGGGRFAGQFTGDPEIDGILAMFVRPPRVVGT